MVVAPRCTAKSQSLQNKGHGSGLRRHAPGLNAKARLAPGSFCSNFIIALGGKLIRTELLFVCLELGGLGLDKGFCWVLGRAATVALVTARRLFAVRPSVFRSD